MKHIFVLGLLTLATACDGQILCHECEDNTDTTSGEEALNKALLRYAEEIGTLYKIREVKSVKSSKKPVQRFVINADFEYNNNTTLVNCDIGVQYAFQDPGKDDTPRLINLWCNDTDFINEQILLFSLRFYNNKKGSEYKLVKINSVASTEGTVVIYIINADLSEKDRKLPNCDIIIKVDTNLIVWVMEPGLDSLLK